MLKGSNRWEKVENYSVLAIVAGAIFMSIGFGLSAISSQGLSASMAMTGGFIVIIATTILIFTLVAKEGK